MSRDVARVWEVPTHRGAIDALCRAVAEFGSQSGLAAERVPGLAQAVGEVVGCAVARRATPAEQLVIEAEVAGGALTVRVCAGVNGVDGDLRVHFPLAS